MTGARVYPAVLAVVALAGCGSGAERPVLAPPAEARTIELNWVERGTGPRFVYRVRRLVLQAEGWSADVSVRNATRDDFRIGNPGERAPLFGLVLLETESRTELQELTADLNMEPPVLLADRISPRPPVFLRAGTTWRGTLSGPTTLRSGTVVRLIFGRFARRGARGVTTWVTDHAVRL
jgi:hypothetical protein